MSGRISSGRSGPAGIGSVRNGSADSNRAGIGYYVHHHGRGHTNRARQIIPHLAYPVTVFSSSPHAQEPWPNGQVTLVNLPLDVEDASSPPPDWPDIFHYAPLNVRGIRERMLQIAQWAAATNPRLLVVDVSVEIALFARLLSVPTVIVRQSGRRTDPPHRAAYRSSSGLLAPYAAALEEPDMPQWIRDKTFYAGGFSRYGGQSLSRRPARQQLSMPPDQPVVVVMSGWGGQGNPLATIALAAQACPDWQWWVVGPAPASIDPLPGNVTVVGAVADTFPYLVAADVVVGSAGNNTVMEVATAGTPFVCIPEARPFDEQLRKAEAIARTGGALMLPDWPTPPQWSDLLERARGGKAQKLAELVNLRGAEDAADFINRIAAASS